MKYVFCSYFDLKILVSVNAKNSANLVNFLIIYIFLIILSRFNISRQSFFDYYNKIGLAKMCYDLYQSSRNNWRGQE